MSAILRSKNQDITMVRLVVLINFCPNEAICIYKALDSIFCIGLSSTSYILMIFTRLENRKSVIGVDNDNYSSNLLNYQ